MSRRGALLLASFAGLVALGLLRFHDAVFTHAQLADEDGYVAAFDLVRAHRSPYEATRYVYPPALAYVGAALVAHLGAHATALVLRIVNVLGAATACGTAVEGTRAGTPSLRFLAAAALLCLAPPATTAVEYGNLSGAALGAALLGLFVLESTPVAAAVLLALAIVLKPFVLVALVIVARRAPRTSAAAAALSVAAMLPGAGAMLRAAVAPHDESTGSLVHTLAAIGLRVPWWTIAVAVTCLGVAFALRRPDPRRIACCASVLAAPLVWDHTMLLALPAIAIAATSARTTLARVSVALGALVVLGTRAWSSFPEAPALGLVPLAAFVTLTAYTERP